MANNSIVDYLNSQGQASDFGTRSKLAQQNGISNYTGTADQNLSLLSTLQKIPTAQNTQVKQTTISPTNLSTPNPTISANGLQTEKINIPYATPSSNTNTPSYNYASSGMQQIATPYSDQNQNISKLMMDVLPKLQGQSTELEKQKQAANIPQLQQKLQDYNSQILTKQAELQQDDINLAQSLQNIEDQTIPMQFITGQQLSVAKRADLARSLKVSEVNTLNALALASQGNIALAQQQAEDATNAKFAPFKEMYSLLQEQQKAIQPFVNDEQKKVSELNQQYFQFKMKELDYQKQDESDFNKLLITATTNGAPQDIIQSAIKKYKDSGSLTAGASVLGVYGGDKYLENRDLFQQIRNSGVSSPTQLTIDNGFNFEDYKKGISTVESGGNYNAIGPKTKSGDQAYGKYQVMGSNIPSWTKEALGYSMTPQQFLNNSEAQEAVFKNQSERNYAKYGNWGDAASVWFTGRPIAKNGNASDGYNTASQYIAKVMNGMGVGQVAAIDPVTASWVSQIQSGKETISSVPSEYRNKVVVALGETPATSTLKPVKDEEITKLNDSITAKNSLVNLIQQYKNNIDKYGTGESLSGTGKGQKESLTTSILLAVKKLEGTGALDQGTIDVVKGVLPENAFFARSDTQKAKLDNLLSTISNRTDEYINSYKGTTAETDPRTSRAFPKPTEEYFWVTNNVAPNLLGNSNGGVTTSSISSWASQYQR